MLNNTKKEISRIAFKRGRDIFFIVFVLHTMYTAIHIPKYKQLLVCSLPHANAAFFLRNGRIIPDLGRRWPLVADRPQTSCESGQRGYDVKSFLRLPRCRIRYALPGIISLSAR